MHDTEELVKFVWLLFWADVCIDETVLNALLFARHLRALGYTYDAD